MDISEPNIIIPWKNVNECEELIKYLLNKTSNPIKCRQLLIQLQLLTNSSDEYHLQLIETLIKYCQSTYKEEFRNNHNISFVLLNILTKNQSSNVDYQKLLYLLENEDKNLFQMKIRELNRRRLNNQQLLTTNNIFDIFDYSNNSRIEQQFHDYLKLNNYNQDILMNVLVQGEYRLSEPTIGMILDQLEKIDYKLSR
jgi:hypothetical protein